MAIDPITGDGIGVARYIRSPVRPDVAELAVAVADDWQHRGVGTRLTEALAHRARHEGITRFTALLFADNTPMLHLIKSLGVVHEMSVHQGIVELTVELPTDGVGAVTQLLHATAAGELDAAGHPGPARSLRALSDARRAHAAHRTPGDDHSAMDTLRSLDDLDQAFGHLRALIALAAELGTVDVVHCFTDGRDTSPTAAAGYLQTLQGCLTEERVGRVASVIGRFYGMDRDRRWERTQAAYDLIVHGRGEHQSPDAPSAARAAYQRGETDEFITATTIGAAGAIRAGDSVMCFNFRPDRMREIVRALAEPGFGDGDEDLPGWRGRDGAPPVRALVTMTAYQHGWPYPVALRRRPIRSTTLAAVLAARPAPSQLHVAETEKYAHVTYIFNGGVIPATITAVQTVDDCLGQVVAAVHAAAGACVITADHGNAEQLLEPDGSSSTATPSTRCR